MGGQQSSSTKLVLIHMNGCGACIRVRDNWNDACRQLRGIVETEEIERSEDPQLLKTLGIRSLPTIGLYDSSNGKFVKYHGTRSTQSIVEFATRGDANTPSVPTFTLFHWKKCGHCIRMMDEWKKAKRDGVPGAILEDFEAEANEDVMSRFGVDRFPTMLMRMPGGEIEPYHGDHTAASIKKFIRKYV